MSYILIRLTERKDKKVTLLGGDTDGSIHVFITDLKQKETTTTP